MARFFSHTVILPDGTHLADVVVELTARSVSYYPFSREIHSTVYVEHPILLSHRGDLHGCVLASDSQLCSMPGNDTDNALYAYSVAPSSQGTSLLTLLGPAVCM